MIIHASEEYDSLTPLPVIPNMRQLRSVEMTPSAVEQRLNSKNGYSTGQNNQVKDCKPSSRKLVHTYKNGYCHYNGGSKNSKINSQKCQSNRHQNHKSKRRFVTN